MNMSPPYRLVSEILFEENIKKICVCVGAVGNGEFEKEKKTRRRMRIRKRRETRQQASNGHFLFMSNFYVEVPLLIHWI